MRLLASALLACTALAGCATPAKALLFHHVGGNPNCPYGIGYVNDVGNGDFCSATANSLISSGGVAGLVESNTNGAAVMTSVEYTGSYKMSFSDLLAYTPNTNPWLNPGGATDWLGGRHNGYPWNFAGIDYAIGPDTTFAHGDCGVPAVGTVTDAPRYCIAGNWLSGDGAITSGLMTISNYTSPTSARVHVGMVANAYGLPVNDPVTAISGSTITVASAATATVPLETVTFAPTGTPTSGSTVIDCLASVDGLYPYMSVSGSGIHDDTTATSYIPPSSIPVPHTTNAACPDGLNDYALTISYAATTPTGPNLPIYFGDPLPGTAAGTPFCYYAYLQPEVVCNARGVPYSPTNLVMRGWDFGQNNCTQFYSSGNGTNIKSVTMWDDRFRAGSTSACQSGVYFMATITANAAGTAVNQVFLNDDIDGQSVNSTRCNGGPCSANDAFGNLDGEGNIIFAYSACHDLSGRCFTGNEGELSIRAYADIMSNVIDCHNYTGNASNCAHGELMEIGGPTFWRTSLVDYSNIQFLYPTTLLGPNNTASLYLTGGSFSYATMDKAQIENVMAVCNSDSPYQVATSACLAEAAYTNYGAKGNSGIIFHNNILYVPTGGSYSCLSAAAGSTVSTASFTGSIDASGNLTVNLGAADGGTIAAGNNLIVQGAVGSVPTWPLWTKLATYNASTGLGTLNSTLTVSTGTPSVDSVGNKIVPSYIPGITTPGMLVTAGPVGSPTWTGVISQVSGLNTYFYSTTLSGTFPVSAQAIYISAGPQGVDDTGTIDASGFITNYTKVSGIYTATNPTNVSVGMYVVLPSQPNWIGQVTSISGSQINVSTVQGALVSNATTSTVVGYLNGAPNTSPVIAAGSMITTEPETSGTTDFGTTAAANANYGLLSGNQITGWGVSTGTAGCK